MSEEQTTEKSSSGELTISIKKDNIWKYSTFLLLAVVVIGGFVMFNGGDSGTGNVVAPTVNNPTPSQVKVDADDDAVLGNKNAEVTIIEFSDYQCPFCQRFWSDTLPEIKKNYIDTGKVNFVYRDFPLTSIHPMAQPAAEAAECVGEQGGDEAYYEYHDILFTNIQTLSNSNLKAWASELGYDISDCLDKGEMRSEVNKDLADATAAGGRGTPYFVVVGKDGKGTPLSGAQPYNVFEQAIEAAL